MSPHRLIITYEAFFLVVWVDVEVPRWFTVTLFTTMSEGKKPFEESAHTSAQAASGTVALITKK